MENDQAQSNQPLSVQLPPTTPTPMMPVSPKPSQLPLVLLSLLSLTFLSGMVYFYFQAKTLQQQPSPMPTSIGSPTTPQSSPVISNSSDLTYSYEKFSFSYPKTWQLTENTVDDTFFTKNHFTGFDHMIVLHKNSYYLLIGIDTHKTGAEVAGIYLNDKEYQDYLKNRDQITINNKTFMLWKNHTSLEQWNKPASDGPGIYMLSSLSEYIPNKVTNDQKVTYNGYDDYITNKNGNSYMFIKLADKDLGENITPSNIQSDIKSILESIAW